MSETPKNKKSLLILTAVCVVVTLLCVAALATNFFGQRTTAEAAVPAATEAAAGEQTDAAQAYADSPECLAAAEWQAFRATYDADGQILAAAGSAPAEFQEKYGMYLVYSQDMADKLDALTAQYGLKLHQSMSFCYSADELCEKAGIDAFLTDCSECSGYLYDDGSFYFDGVTALPDGPYVGYQFTRLMRGCFSETPLNTDSEDGGEAWDYTAPDGTRLRLTLGSGQSAIFASLPGSFLSVKVLDGTDGNPTYSSAPIDRSGLEAFCGCFDWSKLG